MMRKWLSIFGFIIFFHTVTTAQQYNPDKASFSVSDNAADLLFPAWSENGNLLFYQTNKNGNWDIYAYNLLTDSTFAVAATKADEQHPAWWTEHNAVAFDKTVDGIPGIFCYRFDKKAVYPLFNRNIKCKQPSFDPKGRLVAFSGFDRETERWQVFTYDFIYDNLNRLTRQYNIACFPVFSPKGNKLLYQTKHGINDTTGALHLINWYGQPVKNYDTKPLLKTTFTPDEWRIVYSTVKEENKACLKSMRKDGTSVFDLSGCDENICCPAFSPDGKKLAVSIMHNGHYRIFVFDVTDE